MCTKAGNESGSANIATQCQKIFQFYVKITIKIIGDGLDLKHVKSLGHKMDVYQVEPEGPHHCKKNYHANLEERKTR